MTIGYDRDMMSLVRVRAADPWQLGSLSTTDSSATLTLDPSLMDQARGATVATALFRLMLAEDTVAPVSLRDVSWMGDQFNGCSIQHHDGLHSIGIVLGESCGDALLRERLAGANAITLLSGTSRSHDVTASIRSSIAANGTLSMINELGETLSERPIGVHPGTNFAELTKPAAAGVYYLVLTVDGVVQTRTIVVP
jgi:hypothetical protein